MYNLGIQISMSCSADHGLNVLFLFSFNFLPSLLTKTLHDQYSYPAFPDFFFHFSHFLITFLILLDLLLWLKYLKLLK